MRYFIHLSYFGKQYSGWQVQENDSTVQETINDALKKLLNQHIASMGCGRTDTGVHAKDFYMHFNSDKEVEPEDFRFRLNCVLPKDIAIHKVIPMHDKAHSRFDATARTYEYFMHFRKSAFLEDYSLFQGFYKIDWQKIHEAAKILPTIKDFTALCLKSEDFKTNICDVSHVHWDVIPGAECVLADYNPNTIYKPLSELADGDVGVRFTITSNRFLRGMVRRIVGSLLMVGRGRIGMDEFADNVVNQKPFRVVITAPAKGLYLSKVRYPYFDNDLDSEA